MSNSLTNKKDVFCPTVVPAGTPVAKIMGNVISQSDEAGFLLLAPLGQLKVIEGVYEKEQITSPHELVLGDIFQLPISGDQSCKICQSEIGPTSMEVFTSNKFGSFGFVVDVTHSLIFLSETGTQVRGYVLDGAKYASSQHSIILGGDASAASNYVLIDITEGYYEAGWLGASATNAVFAPNNATPDIPASNAWEI